MKTPFSPQNFEPRYAHGKDGANQVVTKATWLNGSAVACHMVAPVITAGNTSIVVDSGGSLCDAALLAVCPNLYQAGPRC